MSQVYESPLGEGGEEGLGRGSLISLQLKPSSPASEPGRARARHSTLNGSVLFLRGSESRRRRRFGAGFFCLLLIEAAAAVEDRPLLND